MCVCTQEHTSVCGCLNIGICVGRYLDVCGWRSARGQTCAYVKYSTPSVRLAPVPVKPLNLRWMARWMLWISAETWRQKPEGHLGGYSSDGSLGINPLAAVRKSSARACISGSVGDGWSLPPRGFPKMGHNREGIQRNPPVVPLERRCLEGAWSLLLSCPRRVGDIFHFQLTD